MKDLEIYPVYLDEDIEIIRVNGQLYARRTNEESDWNSRVQFWPLFLDEYMEMPYTEENVGKLKGEFEWEGGCRTYPSEIVKSGRAYTRNYANFPLGAKAGEFLARKYQHILDPLDEKESVPLYWCRVQWEIEQAIHPNTALAFDWDTSAVKPDWLHFPLPHFSIMDMEEVKYISMNSKKIYNRLWKKVEAAMDTTKKAPQWSVKPFVDEAVSEYVEDRLPQSFTFSDFREYDWKPDDNELYFTATSSDGESQRFMLRFKTRSVALLMETKGKCWPWTNVHDDNGPWYDFWQIHRPGNGHDYESEIKAVFSGRYFYKDRGSINSFTR